MTKIDELEYEIEQLKDEILLREHEIDSLEQEPALIILDLLSRKSHIPESLIDVIKISKTEIWLDINIEYFSGDGSLHDIYEDTGFHVVQCYFREYDKLRLRFEKS